MCIRDSSGLSTAALAGLSVEQAQAFTPGQLASMTSSQVNALPLNGAGGASAMAFAGDDDLSDLLSSLTV